MLVTRRHVIRAVGAAAGFGAASPWSTRAQGQPPPSPPARGAPPTVISNPPRDFTPGAQPVTYPDPDVLTIDPSFTSLRIGNTPIQRLWTGGYWCEGPAWCSQGRYLVWSDIPNNRQMRYLDDDARVTVF